MKNEEKRSSRKPSARRTIYEPRLRSRLTERRMRRESYLQSSSPIVIRGLGF